MGGQGKRGCIGDERVHGITMEYCEGNLENGKHCDSNMCNEKVMKTETRVAFDSSNDLT